MKYIIGHIKPDLDSTVAPIALKYLFDHIDCYGHKKDETKAVLAGEANNETKFVFDKFKVKIPSVLSRVGESDEFILVDHNEESQRLEGIASDQILEIYDHHKLNLNFTSPIFVTTKPWGSSNTIIYQLIESNDLTLSPKLASLMLCAVLSDTVGLKSATTTAKDKYTVEKLSAIAQIEDINKLTLEIFKAKSDISGLTPTQIVKNDYKILGIAGKKILINQVETVEQEKVLSDKDKLLKAMEKVKAEEEVDHIFVIISDILNINSKIIYQGKEDQALLEKAFSAEPKGHILDIGPKLSRKKDVVPAIEKALS